MVDASNENDHAKLQAAIAAAALVKDGMAVGLGSGTTSSLVIRALGERVATEGLRLLGVPTSVATAVLAKSLRIPLRELDDVEVLDLNLDGADEIDPQFRMIKGRGGALLREKIVASVARCRVTVITPEKRVDTLGLHAPIPVEISPVGTRHIERLLREQGAETQLRMGPDRQPYLTDGGNRIVDCRFPPGQEPERLEARLRATVGVFETGLFIALCDVLLVGHEGGVERVETRFRTLP